MRNVRGEVNMPGVVRGGRHTDYEDFDCAHGGGSGAGLTVHEHFLAH